MTSKGENLLDKMRRSKSNWTREDLSKLYEGFGFIITHGGSHDIVRHPDFPDLRTTLPRHNFLAKGYVEFAVKLIDRLLARKKEGKK